VITELIELADFAQLMNSLNSLKKAVLTEKIKLIEKGIELTEKGSGPRSTPIHKLSVTSMVWNISTGQPGCLSVCAPSQLLHTCSLAEYEKLGKIN